MVTSFPTVLPCNLLIPLLKKRSEIVISITASQHPPNRTKGLRGHIYFYSIQWFQVQRTIHVLLKFYRVYALQLLLQPQAFSTCSLFETSCFVIQTSSVWIPQAVWDHCFLFSSWLFLSFEHFCACYFVLHFVRTIQFTLDDCLLILNDMLCLKSSS